MHQVSFVLIYYNFNDDSEKKGKQIMNFSTMVHSKLKMTRIWKFYEWLCRYFSGFDLEMYLQ